jgi:hypothetical protein
MTITDDSEIHNNFAGDAGAGGYQVIIGGTGGLGGNGGAIYNTGTATITDSHINSTPLVTVVVELTEVMVDY